MAVSVLHIVPYHLHLKHCCPCANVPAAVDARLTHVDVLRTNLCALIFVSVWTTAKTLKTLD
jgi:hypothetical protein